MRTVKSIRCDLELSQREMAKQLGLCSSWYCQKEQGKKEWSAIELLKISQMSGVPMNDIKIM